MAGEQGTSIAVWPRKILYDILQSGPAAAPRVGPLTRQGLAIVLSALMIIVPMGLGDAFAQSPPDRPAEESSQPGPQEQPLSAGQLDQLVAPVALYPDALVAQVLAAATYPTQVVEADRWRQAQGNAPAEQIAAGAETQNWDPSVKALTAFPTVLAQLDRNLRWTTDLGNAYYNQPQDVMDAVQAMRQKARDAGQLRSTPQQVVTSAGGMITVAPANPTVVYVPVYNPWVVYGGPFPIYPGYYYAAPPGIFWGGLAIGFGVGIGIGYFAHWGWGWGHWGMGWHEHAVFYNHNTYITRSMTVVNRGFYRPGGPPRGVGLRGSYARSAGFNRPGGPPRMAGAHEGYARPGGLNRPGESVNRQNAGSRGAAGPNRAANASYHPAAASARAAGAYGHQGGGPGAGARMSTVHRAGASSASGRSGGGHGGGHGSQHKG